jgi:hypothetical protein
LNKIDAASNRIRSTLEQDPYGLEHDRLVAMATMNTIDFAGEGLNRPHPSRRQRRRFASLADLVRGRDSTGYRSLGDHAWRW